MKKEYLDFIYYLPFIIFLIGWIAYLKPRIEIIIFTLIMIFTFTVLIPKWSEFITKKKHEDENNE